MVKFTLKSLLKLMPLNLLWEVLNQRLLRRILMHSSSILNKSIEMEISISQKKNGPLSCMRDKWEQDLFHKICMTLFGLMLIKDTKILKH